MKHLAKAAAVFWSWCILSAAAQFIPAATIVRDVDSFHVRKNGEFTQIIETALRVETQQGVRRHGERKLYYNSKLEALEILEAYTQQPDGTRVDVDADKIRTQDGDGSAIFSDDKVRVIIYPKVEIGSLLVLKARSVQITPVFPGHFTWSRYFNPHHHYESATINLTHEPGIRLQFDADRVQGGRLPAQPGDAPGMGRYRFTYQQMQAYPGETGRVALSDFAPHIALSSFADYGAFAKAYHARAKPMAAVTPAIAKLAQALTAGATDGEAHERAAGGADDLVEFVGALDLVEVGRLEALQEIERATDDEARRLVDAERVTGELLADKLIVRHSRV